MHRHERPVTGRNSVRYIGIGAAAGRARPMPDAARASVAGMVGAAVAAVITAGLAAASRRTARAELAASRARLMAAEEAARRKVERDLHDGVQQRVVSLKLELSSLEAELRRHDRLRPRLEQAVRDATEILNDLREVAHGIYPRVLSNGGIEPALKALSRRSPIPVNLDTSIDQDLDGQVKTGVYYVVAEALTNAAKHAHASALHVGVRTENNVLRLTVRDDGVGGADPRRGSGLTGLEDRVESMNGRIKVTSPVGKGTTLSAEIPIERPTTMRECHPDLV